MRWRLWWSLCNPSDTVAVQAESWRSLSVIISEHMWNKISDRLHDRPSERNEMNHVPCQSCQNLTEIRQTGSTPAGLYVMPQVLEKDKFADWWKFYLQPGPVGLSPFHLNNFVCKRCWKIGFRKSEGQKQLQDLRNPWVSLVPIRHSYEKILAINFQLAACRSVQDWQSIR